MKTPRTHPHDGLRRREFLKQTGIGAGALALGLSRVTRAASTSIRPEGANGDVRIGVVGVGAADAKGGVGGRGLQLMGSLLKVPGTRIVALCDVDRGIAGRQAGALKDLGHPVTVHTDVRRLLEDATVDAVVVATPNHWHALATVWACQAGKDVYVEKPASQTIWEGRQMVAAARKHGRIVQVGTQARSSPVLQEAFEWVRRGELGPIRFARIIVYRQRASIGKVAGPTPIPAEIDYDLWCGPVENVPLKRAQLHYDWHWVWATGCGEMGNNGVHYLDMCRWALKLDTLAPRVLSLGGRFGFEDDGETPNTQVAVLDYPSTPVYCEIRGLPEKTGSNVMDSYRGTKMGLVLQCEGGHFAGAHLNGSAFDAQGKKIKEFGPIPWEIMDTGHLANFVAAVRSRKWTDLKADVLEGHLSAGCCHQVNISYRLGRPAAEAAARARTGGTPVLADAVARCHEHLRANGVEFDGREVLGSWLTFDASKERFTGELATEANRLLRRTDRPPFVVPEVGA